MARSPERISSGAAPAAPDGEPQPGLDLRRPGRVENHIVGAPVGRHRGQAALGQHGQQRDLYARGPQQPAQLPGADEVAPGIDQDGVRHGRVRQRGGVGRTGPYRVEQQADCWQDLPGRLGSAGEQEKLTQLLPPPPWERSAGETDY